MSGIVVALTPSQWGDVLRGLKTLIGQPGISPARADEIKALGRQVQHQVDACTVAGDPVEAKRRDYDYEPDCQTCSDTRMSGYEPDDKGRVFAVACPDCQARA